jgi:hypothetical protein
MYSHTKVVVVVDQFRIKIGKLLLVNCTTPTQMHNSFNHACFTTIVLQHQLLHQHTESHCLSSHASTFSSFKQRMWSANKFASARMYQKYNFRTTELWLDPRPTNSCIDPWSSNRTNPFTVKPVYTRSPSQASCQLTLCDG